MESGDHRRCLSWEVEKEKVKFHTHLVFGSVTFLYHLKLLPDVLSSFILDVQGGWMLPTDWEHWELAWRLLEGVAGEMVCL
jgi:hypothetical protein